MSARLPYVVRDLNEDLTLRWARDYRDRQDRARDVEEGLWRRTQDPRNAEQSGWRGPGDARRRMLHYRYRYDLDASTGWPQLVLADLYLYSSVAYPLPELAVHRAHVAQALVAGGWERTLVEGTWQHRDLRCVVQHHGAHPQDQRAGRSLPAGYATLDVEVTSAGVTPAPATRDLPWDVLTGGMRMKDRRRTPIVVPDLAELVNYLPFQVEVGCGLSVEAGIPALHRLHEIYRVTDRDTGAFVLDPDADTFLRELLTSPEAKLPELVEMFAACFAAQPTAGHDALRALADGGHLVGPIITNNFDGLTARAGLSECYVRRYDQAVPPVPFLPQARALLVIGSHADRRRVQARARDRGMAVFFLDTEGFWEEGVFVPYPIEGTSAGDRLCRRGAADALTELAEGLGVLRPSTASEVIA
jgi:hypothetical protein